MRRQRQSQSVEYLVRAARPLGTGLQAHGQDLIPTPRRLDGQALDAGPQVVGMGGAASNACTRVRMASTGSWL